MEGVGIQRMKAIRGGACFFVCLGMGHIRMLL